jgi:hypothetical protein
MGWRASMMVLVLALGGGVAMAADTAPAAPSTIGLVFQRDFNGAIGRLDTNVRQLVYSLPVYGSELITTDAKSNTALEFLDKTRLQVGSNSHIVLDHYIYDPATSTGDAALRFSTGIFRFVTGGIKNKQGIQLTTPSASLSIRGTKVIIYVDPQGNSTFYFEEGWGIVTTICGKQTEVHAGQSAMATMACELTVVDGNLTPPDPAVATDLPVPDEITALLDLLDNIEPAAGPSDDNSPTNNAGPPADPPGRGNRASPS